MSAPLLKAVEARLFDIVWLGTPCASFSVLKTDGAQPQLRTRSEPAGVHPMPADWAAYVAKHNALVGLSVAFARMARAVGATYVIENPADRGDDSSSLFSDEFREHAPLWLMPSVQDLVQDSDAHVWVTFPQCALGSEFQKWTTLLADGPAAESLQSLSRLRCSHERHKKVARGFDSDGRSNSMEAGKYPPQMCREIATRMSSALCRGTASSQQAAERESQVAATPSPNWCAAVDAMPEAWPEKQYAQGEALPTALAAEIGFVSRRRAEAEDEERLARRPLPHRTREVDLPERRLEHEEWPAGAPPPPIQVSQLFHAGVYERVLEAIQRVASGLLVAEHAAAAGERPGTIPPVPVEVFEAETTQPEWARQCVWDTTDVHDCRPLQPFSREDPPVQRVSGAFFAEWGERLRWADRDMLHRVCVTGCASFAQCSRDTVIFGHHKGLRTEYLPAREDVELSRANGWVTDGTPHLRTVPARMPPKNVVEQLKWKMNADGTLYRKQKWRVTTDDTIAPSGMSSRNVSICSEDLGNVALPRLAEFAEAVAILRSLAAQMHIEGGESALRRVTLWALDLSNAYRELAAARSDWWMQCFVWYDGVRLDRRCVFGTAHLVDLFERVTSFVLEVAKHRIREYDLAHPYSAPRQEWARWRAEQGLPSDCVYADIYLDDGYGVTCDDGGQAGAERSRAHLAIVEATFREAGWDIAVDKVQRGPSIELLGQLVSVEGAGAVAVQELRRRGLLLDIAEQLCPSRADGSVPRAAVEKLVGRLGYVAQVVAEGKAFLQPLFRLEKVMFWKRVQQRTNSSEVARRKVRVKPRSIHLGGHTPAQMEYRAALRWWEATLSEPVSVPLAPRKYFPAIGEPGCVFVFTDAAREVGTGFGGFTFFRRRAEGDVASLYMHELWAEEVRLDLQRDRISMPAGEAYGAVVLLDGVLSALADVSHAVCFTDSAATARGLTVGGSGTPQLNVALQWLFRRHCRTQFLGIHIPGELNKASDRLSRGKESSVIAEIRLVTSVTTRLRPCAEAAALLQSVRTAEQRDV